MTILARHPRRTFLRSLVGGSLVFPGILAELLRGIASRLPHRADGFEGSVEVDPRVTTRAHLDTMRAHGISRVSLGVQDFDSEVLRLVNRPQPKAITAALCAAARDADYESINFDLIYGLPGQSAATMRHLADGVVELRPDRLAVYSFARVPWIKPAQRKFKDEDVPVGAAKRAHQALKPGGTTPEGTASLYGLVQLWNSVVLHGPAS